MTVNLHVTAKGFNAKFTLFKINSRTSTFCISSSSENSGSDSRRVLETPSNCLFVCLKPADRLQLLIRRLRCYIDDVCCFFASPFTTQPVCRKLSQACWRRRSCCRPYFMIAPGLKVVSSVALGNILFFTFRQHMVVRTRIFLQR